MTKTKATRDTDQPTSTLPLVTQHTIDCVGAEMVWQSPWKPAAPRLGFCRHCGAVAVIRPVTAP